MFDFNDFLKNLEILVNTDSNSHDPVGLNKCVDFLEGLAKEQGLFVKRHHFNDLTGDYLEISNRENPEKYDVIMMGHIDTVQPLDYSKTYPFREDENGYIHGPGISDMKTSTLGMLYIMKELSQKTKDKLSIGILMNTDEELSSRYSEGLTRELCKKIDLALIMEGGTNDGRLSTMRKGSGTYKITFHGLACHAGQILVQPNANALVEMGRWAYELHKLNNKETGLSVNSGMGHSGHAVNVVPDTAELSINIRITKKEQRIEFENKMKELAENPFIEGVTVDIVTEAKKDPMLPNEKTEKYLAIWEKACEKIGLKMVINDMKGGCSDGNITANEGVPTLDHIGSAGSGGHKRIEYTIKNQIPSYISRMVNFLETLADEI